MENQELYRNGILNSGYFHVAIEEGDGSIAVVSASNYSWSAFVTNVSFWFVLGLALLFIVQGAFGIYSFISRKHFSYTARIQLFIFLAFSLPVLAVSITTLTLIGSSSEEAVKKDYLQRSAATSQRVADLFSGDTTEMRLKLEGWMGENVAFSKTDVSVYAADGSLIVTSQPALFENQLVSTKLNREAWKKIVLQGEAQTVTNEQIGKLQYSCAYSAVFSPDTGKLKAIVSLPFFESATYLQKGEILILSNILKVFVVVFLLFSLLSFWAASSLTYPIRFITKSLRQMTFTGQNKRLEWKASDEIGALVNEYNRMVGNLEESRQALAQNEKELAWREMAKQVAHEIKNPLTPMKLTLQQMEQSNELPPGKVRKSVEVLLRQVEILNQIASSFSSFTNMPTAVPQRMELFTLIRNTVSLFEAQEDGVIIFSPNGTSPDVLVDPKSFSRALSNIVINALQSKVEGQPEISVTIETRTLEGHVLISIQDTGRGMTPEVMEKVFQPQFTTKHSGSGLGLALTRQIVIQAGGRIWFDSILGKGSTFYIELPAS